MTRIRSIVGATQRAGELGVHSLDSFNLIVPDLKVAKSFYEEFGLDLQARGNRFDVHTRGHGHRWGAISEGPRKQLSHLSFGVFDDDFSRFKERLPGLVSAGWGLGRHVLGSNYFHYVRDPWGSYAEYSADIDYIPVNCDWQAEDNPPDDSFYLWGPVPPEDFAFNHEISG